MLYLIEWMREYNREARVAAQAARNALATFNYRDQCMAENAAWILDYAPKGSKFVLWAHNPARAK